MAHRIPRVEEQSYRPFTWQERWEALTVPPHIRMGVCGALAGLGIMLWAVSLLGITTDPGTAAPESAAPQKVSVRVTGQACLQDSSSLEGVKVVLHLPEVPLDVERELAKVASNERGDYVLETTFEDVHAPTRCSVSVRCRGYAEKSSGSLSLTGSGPLEARAPSLVLTRQLPSFSK